jgi:hypothetical protein
VRDLGDGFSVCRADHDLIEHHVARVIVKPYMFAAVIVDGPQTEGLDFGAELQLITGPRSRPQATVKVDVGNFRQSTDVVTNSL